MVIMESKGWPRIIFCTIFLLSINIVYAGGFPKTSVSGKSSLDLWEKADFKPVFPNPFSKLTEFWERIAADSYFGPRIGFQYNVKPDADPEDKYYNFPRSLMGMNFEQWFKLGTTGAYFSFREYFVFEGVESETGGLTGSILSFGVVFPNYLKVYIGIGFNREDFQRLAASVGYEFVIKEIHIPVDINVLVPKSKTTTGLSLTEGNTATGLSLTVGLNFLVN
jgi:hypothetical protein